MHYDRQIHYAGTVHVPYNCLTFCAVKPESDWSTLPLFDVVVINHHVALAG